jgi:hypothetical protein
MRLSDGEKVTIRPADGDPVVWHMQRNVVVEKRVDAGYLVRFTDAAPAVQGPIPEDRLERGWVNW